MLCLSNAKAKQCYKRIKDYFKVSVIQGLKAKGFFRNLKISVRREREKTLLLRATLVAITTQK